MIFVVTGKLGACKSLHACRLTIEHLRRGGIVATNMHLNLDKIFYHWVYRVRPGQVLPLDISVDPRLIPRGDFRGTGRRRVMVVLDECLNWFASSESKVDPRKAVWGEWLRQSDKLGQNVYFIAQEFSRAAKWLRELAQVQIDIRNLGQTMLLGMPIGEWLRLQNLYMVIKGDVKCRQVLGWSFALAGPRIWDCYRTAELYGFEASGNAYDGLCIPPAYRIPGLSWLILPFVWFCFIFTRTYML